MTLRVAPGNQGYWVNGTFIAGDIQAAAPGQLTHIGNGFIGEIAEVVAYDQPLPNLTRVKIEGYLASKWGLLSKLPSDHPHKISRPTFGGAQTIVFQPLPDKTPESAPFMLSAESSSGLPVTFTSSDATVASVSGNTVTVHKVGTINIIAKQTGDANWFPAPDTPQQLKVTEVPRSDQTITFDPLAAKQLGDPDFDLSATASSGLAVSYESSNTAVATVDGNTVTIVGQGITTIRASQAGNPAYNPAQIVEQDLQVNKRDQELTFNPLPSLNLSSGIYILNATADSGLAPAFSIDDTTIATVQGNQLTLKAGGTAKITASQGGNATYNPAASVQQTVTVIDDTLQPQVISFTQDLSGKTFGDADFDLTATVDSGLALSYSSSNAAVASIAGNTVTINGAGTVTITVEQPGNDDWQAATATKQLVIAKAGQTITFPPVANKAVGDLDFLAGGSSDSGLTVTYASSDTTVATVAGDRITLKGEGSVTITASQAGNANYNAATDVSRTFDVTLANLFADSYPGLRLWLDANDINADGLADKLSDFLGGGKVDTWKDRSGNGFDATQSQIAKMPVFKPNTQNSRTVVEFTSGFMDIPNLALQGAKDRTIFVVGKSAQGPYIGIGKEQAGQKMVFGRDPSGDKLSVGIGGPGGLYAGAGAVADMSIARAKLKGNKLADFLFAVNGTKESGRGEAVLDTREEGNNRVGGTPDGLGSLTGQIAELLVFDSALTKRMEAKIEGYLAIKWGLRDLLPASHPFKTDNPTFGGSQTINFPAVGDQVVSTGAVELGAFANSGLPIAYTSSDPTVFSITGDLGTILKDGSVTVTAAQAGDNHYTAATSQTSAFTISKENQTITFEAPPDMNKYDDDITLIASSSAGLAITFTINSGPAEILAGTTDVLHIVNDTAGFVSITASQAGTLAYNAAPDVTHTFEINNKEPQAITFAGKGEDGTKLRDIQIGPRPFLIPFAAISGGDSGNPVQLSITGGTAASGTRTEVVTRPDGKKFFKIITKTPGTLDITATQAGGLNNGQEYNPAAPVTRSIDIKNATFNDFKLAMRQHPDYQRRFTKFSEKRTGQTNPETGFTWTTSEITNKFEADVGDPDSDGLSNLLEYAFGGSGMTRDDEERSNLPKKRPLDRKGAGQRHFRFSFVRRASATDPNLSYVVETSNDMYSWTSAGLTEETAVEIDGGMEYVTYKLNKAFNDPDSPRNQFIRLNVTTSE